MKQTFASLILLFSCNGFATTLPVLVQGTYEGDGGCTVTVAETDQQLKVHVTEDAPNGAGAEFPPGQIRVEGDSLIGFRNAGADEEILDLIFDEAGVVLSAKVTDKNFGRTVIQSCTNLKEL